MEKKIVFLRHGSTKYNVEKRWMGSIDLPLNKIGKLEVEKVANKLEKLTIDVIYSSPLIRALETANILRSNFPKNIDLVVLDGLAERSYGELEGKEKNKQDRSILNEISSVESKKIFMERVNSSFLKIDRENALVISHSAVFTAIQELYPNEINSALVKPDNGEFVTLYI
ncbi:histidine phosphatase family protein [Oceanicoccus sp. KOV_DT_Chl]|uniref:histidine phosphatase family protein n=1 Tax=Oceanicoccus sp. KOV_DT_Chl TaxID=1904639 RepID=UPI000C7D1DED|nr:histidine phosphatase family protein [Oceanicoccus sp. KOV_DT_Chl]